MTLEQLKAKHAETKAEMLRLYKQTAPCAKYKNELQVAAAIGAADRALDRLREEIYWAAVRAGLGYDRAVAECRAL